MSKLSLVALAFAVWCLVVQPVRGQMVNDLLPNLQDPVKRLLTGSPEESRAAVAALKALGPKAEPAIPVIISSLTTSRNPYSIRDVLVGLGDPAHEALAKAMNEQPKLKTNFMIETLIMFKNPKDLDLFRAGLKDGNVYSRNDCAYGIAEIASVGDASAAIPDLIALLDDYQGCVVETYSSKTITVRDMAALALSRIGAPAVEALQKISKDNTSPLRRGALYGLSKMHDPGAFDRQAKALKSSNPQERSAAAAALGELKDGRAFDPLVALLKDPDPRVRSNAAVALGTLGDKRASEPLLELTKDSSPLAQSGALRALGQLKDPAAAEVALGALQEKDRNLQAAAIQVLGDLAEPRAVKPLVALLREAADETKQLPGDPDRVVAALVKIGKPSVEPLIELCQAQSLMPPAPTPNRFYGSYRPPYAIIALGKLGDKRATEPILVHLQAKRWVGPCFDALAALKDPRAVETLIRLMDTYAIGPGGLDTQFEQALSACAGTPSVHGRPSWRKWWEENRAKFTKDESPKN